MNNRPIFFAAFLLLMPTATRAVAGPVQPLPSASTVDALDGIKGRYIRMAHNFFVFYDLTLAMDVPYKDTGMPRIEAQKHILQRSNATLPELNGYGYANPVATNATAEGRQLNRRVTIVLRGQS